MSFSRILTPPGVRSQTWILMPLCPCEYLHNMSVYLWLSRGGNTLNVSLFSNWFSDLLGSEGENKKELSEVPNIGVPMIRFGIGQACSFVYMCVYECICACMCVCTRVFIVNVCVCVCTCTHVCNREKWKGYKIFAPFGSICCFSFSLKALYHSHRQPKKRCFRGELA